LKSYGKLKVIKTFKDTATSPFVSKRSNATYSTVQLYYLQKEGSCSFEVDVMMALFLHIEHHVEFKFLKWSSFIGIRLKKNEPES